MCSSPKILDQDYANIWLCIKTNVGQHCMHAYLNIFFTSYFGCGAPLKFGLQTPRDTLVFSCRVVLKIVSSGFRLQIVALLSKNVVSLIDTSIGSGKIEYKKTDFNKIPFRISRSGKRDLLSVASLEQWLAVSYCIKINQLFILSIKSLTTPGSWHVFLIDENSYRREQRSDYVHVS